MSDPTDLNDPESTVTRAATVFKELTKGDRIPDSVQKNAKCIAVFPGVVTAAAGIGAVHGDGVSFCRNSEGNWSRPVFLDLTGGSLGLQLGVKSADLVLYMTSGRAKRMIEEGAFELSGEFGAVAGSFHKTFTAPKDGVIAYTQADGVFAGASLGGVSISQDKDEQRAFYGTYDADSLFEGKIPPKVGNAIQELRTMLPPS